MFLGGDWDRLKAMIMIAAVCWEPVRRGELKIFGHRWQRSAIWMSQLKKGKSIMYPCLIKVAQTDRKKKACRKRIEMKNIHETQNNILDILRKWKPQMDCTTFSIFCVIISQSYIQINHNKYYQNFQMCRGPSDRYRINKFAGEMKYMREHRHRG